VRQPCRPERAVDLGVRFVDADARNEAELVVETIADRRVARAEAPLPVAVLDVGARRKSLPSAPRSWRGENVFAAKPFIVKPPKRKFASNPGHAVETRARDLFVEQHRTHVRVGEHVAAQTQGSEVRGWDALVFALLNVQNADRVGALTSAQSRAAENGQCLSGVGQPDAAREEQPHVLHLVGPSRTEVAAPAAAVLGAEREDALVLQEEIALLWKEQVEPRQVDLLFVGFDLREIRVDGEVPTRVRM
jgi:hypothetical protein